MHHTSTVLETQLVLNMYSIVMSIYESGQHSQTWDMVPNNVDSNQCLTTLLKRTSHLSLFWAEAGLTAEGVCRRVA